MMRTLQKTFLLASLFNLPAVPQNATTPTAASTLPTGNTAIDAYNKDYLLLTRSLMSPKNVADAFGCRIAQRYIAMQITVANRNSEYQWLITDAAINAARLIGYMKKSCAPRADSLTELTLSAIRNANPSFTGADLTVLRGVAEKGQHLDPRNLTLRLLRGSGTTAAGLLGITTFGPSFAPAVAAFNGPFLTAYQTMFPDQTVNQLNRLNDSAYAANTVVAKQQAKVLVVFIPVALFLTKDEQSKFYDDPNSTYSSCVDLRLLDASVDGHFISRLDLAPVITSVAILAAEAGKFATDNFKVTGTVIGRFLDGATIALSNAPEGLTIAPVATASGEKIQFELASVRPLAPHTPITIQVKKAGVPDASFTITADYSPARPVVSSGGVQPASIKQAEQKTVEISGSAFSPQSRLEFVNASGLTIGDLDYVSTTKLKVDIAVASDAVEGLREFVVRTAGGSSGKVALTITR